MTRLKSFAVLAALLAVLVGVRLFAITSGNNLLLTIQQIDSNGVPVLNRVIGPVSFGGSVGQFSLITVGVGLQPVTLPMSNPLQLYVHNLSATNNVTVTLTPANGVSAIVQVLGPGGILVIWQTASTANLGFTALSFTGIAAPSPVEYFIGG